jgi:O-antigen ligase
MIAGLTYLLALLYCFVWLRIPELAGVALPLQRLVAWTGVLVLAAILALGRPLRAGVTAQAFLRFIVLFAAMLLVNLLAQIWAGRQLYALYFFMDLSKYLAIFGAAFLVYYALRNRLADEDRFIRFLILSGTASLVVTCLLLALYYAGMRTDVEIIAHSFGGALGVWPTGGSVPRLAGTTAEPQQLSVVYLTPIMLMLSPEYLRRYWWIALVGTAILILSQSKFAVLSLLILYVFLILTYRRARALLILGGILLAPVAAAVLIRLPTFAALLIEGTSATAFIERLENLFLLLTIARDHLWFGIGAGQYGIFRGEMLYSDPLANPGYTPNMDFLKILAEVGLVGFVVILGMLGSLLYRFFRTRLQLPVRLRPRFLAFLLGALGILLNMLVGYEFLHVFFWLNVGFLMYLAELEWESGREKDPGSSYRHGGLPDPAGEVEAVLR